MRVGIFGGSFDPPHIGHLLGAIDAVETLTLDRLQVVPAAVQPLKGGGRTDGAHRLAMTTRCFGGVPHVEVDPVEILRGGLSFTVDTVEAYRRQWPTADLHLLVGEDAVAGFAQWRDPERLLSMVQVIVLGRASQPASTAAGAAPQGEFWVGRSPPLRLATRRVDVSSTEIRARVKAGRTIRGFVPDAVAAYIASTGLYLQEPEALASPTPA
jgi:nicotinate-nucleotide adenylyltransferase